MIEIKSPNNTDVSKFVKVFLGGSIEQDTAERWQQKLIELEHMQDLPAIFINPRRDIWDSTWVQDPTKGTPFATQVHWELNNLEDCDIPVFYFDPNTTSPITLMELGLTLGSSDTYYPNMRQIIVCCPKTYFRYGNVKITCERSGVEVHEDFESFSNALAKAIENVYIRNLGK